MKELDFDIFVTQDAGRAVYRGLFIYASFLSFQQVLTQMSVGATKWLRFVEQELWRGSNCYIQMKPRLRLFYSAMICSFVPYLTREAYNYQTKSLGLKPITQHTWTSHLALGALNGSLIVGLTLTTQGPIMLGGSVIGAGHSALFLLSLKYFTSQIDVYTEKESKFVDQDFKL